MDTTALTTFFERVKARFELPSNKRDHLLGQRNGELFPVSTVAEVSIIESDAEMEALKGVGESFDTVFNEWLRISRLVTQGGKWSNESIPSELTQWEYSAATNSIVCTVNSSSVVGFIAPSYFDNYVLETRLSSDNSDDDYIGLCIAFATDADGNTHTLTVTRQLNGPAPMMVIKDWRVEEYTVANVFGGLKWPTGEVATEARPNSSNEGWDLFPVGIMLKVTRDGDTIVIETSQVGEGTYHEPAKTTIDLSADPELEVFRGPQRWGYICHSQLGSTWEVLQRPGESDFIYDRRTHDLWRMDLGEWTKVPYSLQSAIDDGRLVEDWLHFNTITGKCFYVGAGPTMTRL